MKPVWVLVHVLGFVLWLGGGLSAMMLAIWSRGLERGQLNLVMRGQATIYRRMMLPGSIFTVVSGIMLSLLIYRGPAANHGIMLMQVTGLLAALITLLVLNPNIARLERIDPVTDPQRFDVLRARQARFGMISGVLSLLALIGGAVGRP